MTCASTTPDPTNYFVDAMCIPSCCQNQELAEVFINYMLSAEPAIANAEYIYYASPNSLVYEDEGYLEDIGEEAVAILYPRCGELLPALQHLRLPQSGHRHSGLYQHPVGEPEDKLIFNRKFYLTVSMDCAKVAPTNDEEE